MIINPAKIPKDPNKSSPVFMLLFLQATIKDFLDGAQLQIFYALL